MVCLGNICRSPLAEGIMQHLVKQNGLDWEVDSAGTGNWHVGQGPDKRSTSTAREVSRASRAIYVTERARFRPRVLTR